MISVILFYMTFVSSIFLAFRNGAVYIFVLYQGYYFFNPPTKWWGQHIPDIRFSFYIVVALLVIVIINWKAFSSNKISKIPQFMWIYIVVILYGIASFYAVLPIIHTIAFDAVLTVAIVITLAYKIIQTEKHLDIAIGAYVVFAAYLGYYMTQFGRNSAGGRFEGAGMVDSPDVNGLAAALGPALLFCLYYFWLHPNWKIKLACIVLGAFTANGLVLAGSRGAFLGVAMATAIFVFYMFFSNTTKKNQRWSAVAIVLLGLAGVITVTDSYFWERIVTIKTEGLERSTEIQTGSTRLFFWAAAIDMSKDYPFGGGASAFIYYSPQYIPEEIDTGGSRNRAVHSTWFEVLSEIGYLGLIAFSAVILSSFITLRRTLKRTVELGDHRKYFKVVAVGSALICFCVTMSFVNRFRAEILYWCILYSACIYNIYVLKAPKTSKEALIEQS